jgi:hypothetical protein
LRPLEKQSDELGVNLRIFSIASALSKHEPPCVCPTVIEVVHEPFDHKVHTHEVGGKGQKVIDWFVTVFLEERSFVDGRRNNIEL